MATVEENLRNILQVIAEKEDYKLAKLDITPISTEGSNYTTILYVATISEELKPDLHLFAKVAVVTDEMRAQNEILTTVFHTENVFYSELAPKFEKLYNKNNVPVKDRLVIPKYYGHAATTGKEILVLENLEKKGFLNYNRLKPFEWEYASTAATELAKYHALGLALRDESPTNFEKNIAFGYSLLSDDKSSKEIFCYGLVKRSEFVDNKYKSNLQPYCKEEKFMELKAAIDRKSTMLVFGDFRPSNLMHRWQNGKLELVTLDYQTLSLGNPAVDLVYFIFSASDEEFRRLHYQQLLDHYFLQLTIALKQLNVDVEKVYSKKTFENDMDEIFGLYMGLGLLPLFLVDPEDAPEDVSDIDGFLVKPSKIAVERMNGIVRDFVKWGVI